MLKGDDCLKCLVLKLYSASSQGNAVCYATRACSKASVTPANNCFTNKESLDVVLRCSNNKNHPHPSKGFSSTWLYSHHSLEVTSNRIFCYLSPLRAIAGVRSRAADCSSWPHDRAARSVTNTLRGLDTACGGIRCLARVTLSYASGKIPRQSTCN